MYTIQNYIDGRFQNAINSKSMESLNPATEGAIATLPNSDYRDVQNAVESAEQAFQNWSQTTPSYRSKFLHAIADGIEKKFDAFALAETEDTGKPLWLSKKVDIPRAIANFRFFADHILTIKDFSVQKDEKATSLITRHPVGVAALITPWNLPLYLLTWKIAPALACGNTVVCKPSEVTPVTAFLLSQLMDEIGLPKGVCNMVFGTGQDVGEFLVAHPKVRLVSFTGGTQTGRAIEKAIAGSFKKTSMELGGKNPIVVDQDADIDQTVEWVIKASFMNQGQICLCGERIFVHQKIFEMFLEKFIKETKKLTVGDPMIEQSFMGPLVSKMHFDKVKNSIALRIKEGARLVAGDENIEHEKGYYLRPTILTGLTKDNACHVDEIFGPVVTVEPFETIEEVTRIINESPYGLCAAVFSKDQKRAQEVAKKIQAATVWINCWLVRDLRVPFGGVKNSGLGREGGDYSVDFYTEYQTICTGT